jgi:multimeric flavodoxin WrbA
MTQIIGISGSPVPNSNTDRLIKHILQKSNLESAFIKLSDINIGPCRACKRCVKDNICKIADDFPAVAEKLLKAEALVLGVYTPYGMIDAWTKSFLERLWSMRHIHGQNQGKICITVASGLSAETRTSVLRSLAVELRMEKTRHIAELQIEGNVPCLTCGVGDHCWGSGVKRRHGDVKASSALCKSVEEQSVWKEAAHFGELIGRYIDGDDIILPIVM